MKLTIEQLKDKLAETCLKQADRESLESVFLESQYNFFSQLSDTELKEYASEFLGYDVDDEL